MTLHATRAGQKVTIHSNLGIGDAHSQHQVTEHASHLRHFHGQLGALLDDADAERAGHQAHAEHAGHVHQDVQHTTSVASGAHQTHAVEL